jgi:uncharacterized lipoprotein
MPSRFCLTLAVVLLLAGCSRGETVKCGGNTAYRSAVSEGQLRIPDDLSVPDETDALRIPVPSPPRDQEDGTACLEYSPAFAQVPEAPEAEED